jgi:hypothetical protein
MPQTGAQDDETKAIVHDLSPTRAQESNEGIDHGLRQSSKSRDSPRGIPRQTQLV